MLGQSPLLSHPNTGEGSAVLGQSPLLSHPNTGEG